MPLATGAKLVSAVCPAQAIVIRAPEGEGVIACGGHPMAVGGEAPTDAPALADLQEGHAVTGKRYVDQASGLEVLCTKAGKGAFAYDGRPLTLKEAKPLPASD